MDAQVYNVSYWIKTEDQDSTIEYLEKCIADCNFDLISRQEKKFTPVGYTSLWLLGESHFAVHTFPEMSKIYIELCSCNLGKLEAFALKVESAPIFDSEMRYKHI